MSVIFISFVKRKKNCALCQPLRNLTRSYPGSIQRPARDEYPRLSKTPFDVNEINKDRADRIFELQSDEPVQNPRKHDTKE